MRYHSLTVSAIALLSASQAFAQAADPFVLGTIYLGTDVSSTDGEFGLDNEDLTRINPSDLQDVFKSEPTVQVGSSLPVSQKIYVNGVEENNLSVTIDGARQNNRIFHHSATTYIDPELLRAVRVDPGVAPADAGPGALAGAIAFETKDVDDLLAEGLSFGGRFSTEYQDNGDTWTNSLAVFGRTGGFEYLLFGKRATGGFREDGAGANITGSETALTSGLAKFALNMSNGGRLEFSYENVEDDAQRPNRADFGGLVRGGVLNDGTRTYRLERQNAVITYTTDGSDPMWNPTVQLAFNSTDLFTGPFTGATDAYSGTSSSLTGKFQNEFALANGTITAGLDFYRDTVDITGEATAVGFFAEEKANNLGVFAQARLDVTEQLRVSGGLRYDFQSFEGVDGTEYDNSGLSANLAADFDVSDHLTISAGASRGWGGIALAESFLFDTAWTYPASIEPVTSENYYLGFNAAFDNGFGLNGKIFKSNINNVRTLYNGTTETFGTNPGDTSDLDTEGLELGVSYNWGAGFARLAFAKVSADVEGFDADSYTGRYLTTPLGDTIVFEVAHTFDQHGLTIGADAQRTFGQDITYLGAPSGTTQSYTVVNVFAEYKPRRVDGLTIRAGISNLFDEEYAESASYGQEFGSVVPLNEPGRTISLKLTYEF